MTCRKNDLVCCCVRFVSVLYFLMKSYTKRTHILVNHYPECFLELGMSVLGEKNKSSIMTKEPACVYDERRESLLPKVMKDEIRDDDVELFSWCEPKHVTLLEINPAREAKNFHVFFRSLEA